MKKLIYIFSILTILFSMAACTKENVEPVRVQTEEENSRVFQSQDPDDGGIIDNDNDDDDMDEDDDRIVDPDNSDDDMDEDDEIVDPDNNDDDMDEDNDGVVNSTLKVQTEKEL